jgi:hypothetical protein
LYPLVQPITAKDRIQLMLSKVHLPVLLCLISFTDIPLRAQQTLEPFSSEVTYTVNGETHTGKIYSDGHSVRLESEESVHGPRNLTFVRLASGVTQVVIPQERAYSESPYGAPSDAPFIRYLRDAKVKSKPLGVEQFDGQDCEKFLVSANYKEHTYSSIEWRSRNLHGFVVRSQDAQELWLTEYRNIHLGPQTTSLFQLPDGYIQIAYSQDWTAVVRQIQFAGGLSKGIAIARIAGLKAVGNDGILVTEHTPLPRDFFTISFIDPVTGNEVLHESINTDSFPIILPAPSLKSPENGIVFNHYPRKTQLQWGKVPGAISYVVQVDIFSFGGAEKPHWATDEGLTYIQQTLKDETFSFEFAGAQPGRWRVWAVDARGTEGRKSVWSAFQFTQ